MGLTNYPQRHACKEKGTAVLVAITDNNGEPIVEEDGEKQYLVDCDATIAAGGCPWKRVLGNKKGAGIDAGMRCSYRGKYGAWLLDAVGLYGDALYEDLKGHECKDLAEQMRNKYEVDGVRMLVTVTDSDERAGEDITDDFWYLHDWLIFIGRHSNGFHASW